MTTQIPTNEQLMALADGSLDPGEAAALRQLVEQDPALAEKVEMFRKTRDVLQRVRGPLAGDPVPDTLRQSVEAMLAEANPPSRSPTQVVQFSRRLPASPVSARPWTLPLAASIAAVIAGLGGYYAGMDGGGVVPSSHVSVGELLPQDLAEVLSTTASGSDKTLARGQAKVIASVWTRGDELCREFEVNDAAGQTVVGIGCREDKGWRLNIAVAAPRTGEGFAPASSLQAIDNYLGMIEAGEPLTAEEEAKALQQSPQR